jgi:hypothetical protein
MWDRARDVSDTIDIGRTLSTIDLNLLFSRTLAGHFLREDTSKFTKRYCISHTVKSTFSLITMATWLICHHYCI